MISAVIVCKNEADVIEQCINSVKAFADDIVVYDNGSTDGTQNIVKKSGSRIYEGKWEGFGKTKKKAVNLAKNDWILHLDADEAVDEKLKQSIQALNFNDASVVYTMRFKNFFGKKLIRFGEWGNDRHIRLFNRRLVNWNDAEVHESLILPPNVKIKLLNGAVLHQTVNNVTEYAEKTVKYALLNAEKYYRTGRQSSTLKIYLAPVFAFIKYYILKLGFLDGREGFICARMTAYYTFLKYSKLKKLRKANTDNI